MTTLATSDVDVREDVDSDSSCVDSAGARPWRRAAGVAFWVWLASHLAMLIVSLVAKLPNSQAGVALSQLVHEWQWGDTDHFITIAQNGYGDPWEITAFFPVYPVLIAAFDVVVPGNAFIAALVVSSLAGYGVLVFMHRLAALELGEEIAGRAVYYLAVFPLAFFLHIGFNTSVFMLAVMAALYNARRGNWWVAGLCGAVASGTRSSGVLLGGALLFEYLRQRQFRIRAIKPNVLALALVPAGLAAFSLYCWWKLGNPLQYVEAQGYWGRELDWPWVGFWRAFSDLNDAPALDPLTLYNLSDITYGLIGVIGVTLCVVGPWRLRADQGYLVVYGITSLLLALSFPVNGALAMLSTGRFVLEIVPIFLILAKIGANRKLEPLYVMPAMAVQAVWMVLLLNNTRGD